MALFDPAVLLAAAIAFCVVVYVLADGFDLGIGILFLVAPREVDRDAMMESIEPVWDGNETWLVMGGTFLFAVFPAAYYVILPAMYLPVVFMLFALIFRGVSFGFRVQATRFRRVWDVAFSVGSVAAAFCQGLILGGLIEGVPMRDGMFDGGPFAFVSVLGLLCGAGLVAGYALLGAGWLIWRTGGGTQVFGRDVAHAALLATMAMMVLVSGWTALTVPEVAARWFSWPNLAFLAPVPIVTAAVAVLLWRSLWGRHGPRPFLLSIGLFLLGFAGLVVSLWPYVVPRRVTIWDGLNDPQSVAFAGIGVAIVLPIVLGYQAHAYRVFRRRPTEP